MLTVEQVKNNITNYKIENGIVIDKSNNQPVQDEDRILEVKSSILFYTEAKEKYDRLLKQSHSGQLKYGLGHFVEEQMKDFSVNNEVQTQGSISPHNKLTNEILNSNGNIQEFWMGDDLKNGKYSILLEPKKSYYLAYLKLKFREKGLDIDDITISIDTSQFAHTGNSKISINYNLKKYDNKKGQQVVEPKKEEQVIQSTQQTLYQHPMANELNELEKQKQIAKQNNDEDAYKYAQSNIERIINQNQAIISPEKWDSLSIDEQIAFVRLKINESKILHDKDAFDYWNANLGSLEAKKTQTSIIDDKLAEKPPERPVEDKSDSLDFSVMINQLRTQNSQISSEYKSMLSDGYIDDEELAILISRLKDLSDNASVIKSMVTDQNQEIMIDSIIEMINKESIKMTTMQRGIEETNHSFGR